MDVAKLLGFAVAGALCAAILKKLRPEFSVAAGTLAACAALAAAVAALSPVLTLFRSLADAVPDGETYLKALLKAAGAATLSAFASDICLDCEQHALSRASLLIGRAAVILVSLPIFTSLADTAVSMIKTFG